MKERFLNIRKVAGKKIEDFLGLVLDIPPTYEEAYLNFRHGRRCSMKENLVSFTVSKAVAPFDPSGLGIGRNEVVVKFNYLECPECHVSKRYSG